MFDRRPSTAAIVVTFHLLLAVASQPASADDEPSYCELAALRVRRVAVSSFGAAALSASPTVAAAAQDRALHGMFGRQSPRADASGTLVHVIDGGGRHTGCTDDLVNAPPTRKGSSGSGGGDESAAARGWIALVRRGGCRIADKVHTMVEVHGAAAVIVYNIANQSLEALAHKGYPAVVVSIGDVDGRQLISWLSDTTSEITVDIRPADPDDGSDLDPLTIFVTTMMTLLAIALNSVAIIAICRRREKMKPHQYLVVNLIATDLFIGVLGAVQVAVSYQFFHDACMEQADQERSRCSGSVLSRFWNVLLYSNLFTLLLLTAEHFVACRWPFWHKIILTRGKVALAVALCWLASCLPDAVVFAMEYDAASAKNVTLCAYLVAESIGAEEWAVSATLVAIISAVLGTLLGVYGYILYLIHGASIGKIEAKKKRNAVVTTLLLLLSFAASYLLFYVVHFSVAVDRTAQSRLIVQLQRALRGSFPTSPLLIDYVVTGMLGAVLDPLIYCARTKEVKLFLLKLFKKNVPRSRAASSYAGTASSTMVTGVDYTTVVTAMAEDDQL